MSIGGATKDSTISKFCEQNFISGFEFLRGIPGTLGGNIKMNAGCYGKTISDNLISCKIINRKGEITDLCKEEIKFSYRKTSIEKDSIITSANFKINLLNKKKISQKSKRNFKKKEFPHSQSIAGPVVVPLKIHLMSLHGNLLIK